MKILIQSKVESRKSKVFRLRGFFGSRPSTLDPRPSQRGIALVITLILLSVTLIMAIAFLAVSRRERNAVTTTTDAATAKLAADSALAHAEAQIVVNVFVTTNPCNFGLLVSTNYINPLAFPAPGLGILNPTNANYNYTNGAPLNAADSLINLANLLYSPRPPVFIPTNSIGSNDFRFYIDLNRNGRFEDTLSNAPNVQIVGATVVTNGTISEVGDPQWIGQLARPDLPHGPNNFFVARYAFFAAPAGNTLDLNYIYNQTKTESVNPANDGFFRNQGVGSWEINLAAFLADLNTNEWGQNIAGIPDVYYHYKEPTGANLGHAFEDACALLAYRYNNNYNSLFPAAALFPISTLAGPVDIYPFELPMTNTAVLFYTYNLNTLWPGADNTNHYFDLTADLFDPTKVENGVTPPTPGFIERMNQASAGISTYDRYTFYRMLSQLGTDSEPEQGKINLNYINVDAGGNIVPNRETNLFAWTPAQFFTNAADRMLRLYTTNWFKANPTKYLATYYGVTNYYGDTNYYHVNPDFSVLTNDPTGLGLTNIPLFGMTNQVPGFGLTAIPVLVNGNFVYSSSVNRLFQLAANFYDASTNNPAALGGNYPSVFRPIFFRDNSTNVFIIGYEPVVSVTGDTDPQLNQPEDVTSLPVGVSTAVIPHPNVYGVPWIIGAKKGFPNFNEFSMEDIVQVTRKMQVTRNTTNNTPPARVYTNSQMYTFSISNSIGVECWNSYATNYPNPVEVAVRENLSMWLTNGSGSVLVQTNFSVFVTTNVSSWPGSAPWSPDPQPNSFVIPLQTSVPFLPESIYQFGSASFILSALNPPWENVILTKLPDFILLTTNRLQVFILDGNHVIDYVHLAGPDGYRDLNAELNGPDDADPSGDGLWRTNLYGATNQIKLSRGLFVPNQLPPVDGPSSSAGWKKPPGAPAGISTPPQIQAYFQALFTPTSVGSASAGFGYPNDPGETNKSPGTQAGYTPTRTMVQYVSWQANDPLVHYISSDLNYSGYDQNNVLKAGITVVNWNNVSPPILPDIGNLNQRYKPWGQALISPYDKNPYNFAYKDSLITNSDAWDFPANKFPTVGWLGRVHRGTPWQTVFLKATNILDVGFITWTNWTGSANAFEATNISPVQDRLMFDVFTTTLNDNAARGQLSVNQSGLAAWSALFSGIAVPTSLTNTYTIIDPAGPGNVNSTPVPPLLQLVTNINYARATLTNIDGVVGSFEHVGDILATPKLTEKSPFILSTLNPNVEISDELYEWLPQQMMSLLRSPTAPRYVVYCYGQTLKPAQNSLVTGGQFFGMCTNYQIVSEAVVRAIIRVDGANTSHPRAVVESYNLLPPD